MGFESVKNIFRAASNNVSIALLLLFSLTFGIWHVIDSNPGTLDSAAALLLLIVVSSGVALLQLKDNIKNKSDCFLSWVMLAIGITAMLAGLAYSLPLLKNIGLMSGGAVIVIDRSGYQKLRWLWIPLTLSFIILPMLEVVTLMISFPLRLISTEATVAVLHISGMEISSNMTSIFWGKTTVAITDACSGVGQLGVLLFFAYIMGIKNIGRSCYYHLTRIVMLLPIVIIANVIRLLVTIGLFKIIGERAFENDIHVALGYFFVILSLLMLYLFGMVQRAMCKVENE